MLYWLFIVWFAETLKLYFTGFKATLPKYKFLLLKQLNVRYNLTKLNFLIYSGAYLPVLVKKL